MEREPIRALVVAVDLRRPNRPLEPELAEFEALIEAVGGVVVERVVQRLDRVDPATLIGSGKANEIARHVAEMSPEKAPNTLFIFNDLRSRQRTNLEKSFRYRLSIARC